MTAHDTAYAELCDGCIDEKTCHEDLDYCDRYWKRVEELEADNG